MNYDTVADTTNFVKEMFPEEEPMSRVVDIDNQMVQTGDEDISNGDIVNNTNRAPDDAVDKQQSGDVRQSLPYKFL